MGIRQRRTRTEQNEDNRRRLLDAATRVFVSDGYHGATLDRVAEKAGFTKGVVYSRFASKAALFLELYEAHVARRVAEVAALPPAPTTATIEAISEQWLARMRLDAAWSLLLIEFRIEAARHRTLAARYAELHDRLVAAFAAILARDAAAAGVELTASADEVARLGLAIGTGFLLERTAAPAALGDDALRRINRAMLAAITRPRRRRS